MSLKMDVLGVHNHHHQKKIANGRKLGGGATRRRSSADKGIKVVYISSPMKVKTSAAEFRATVQGLTGRDSDVARFMDADDGGEKPRGQSVDERGFMATGDYCVAGNSSFSNNNCGFGMNSHNNSSCESPTESDLAFEPFEAGSLHGCERGMAFPSNYFNESTFLDVLSGFDAMA